MMKILNSTPLLMLAFILSVMVLTAQADERWPGGPNRGDVPRDDTGRPVPMPGHVMPGPDGRYHPGGPVPGPGWARPDMRPVPPPVVPRPVPGPVWGPDMRPHPPIGPRPVPGPVWPGPVVRPHPPVGPVYGPYYPEPYPRPYPGPDYRPDPLLEDHWRHGHMIEDRGFVRYRPLMPIPEIHIRQGYSHFSCYEGDWLNFLYRDLPGGNYPYLIGSTELTQSTDYDFINVDDYANCVSAVRVRVEGADAFIDRIVVTFTDGTDADISVAGFFPRGSGDYSWRDLRGQFGSNCVSSFVVIGNTATPRFWDSFLNTNRARVELWGLR